MPTNQTQQKRIVIIEGDAFDADAIVAIYKIVDRDFAFGVCCGATGAGGEDLDFDYHRPDAPARDAAMAVAVDAWRKAVGDPVGAIPPVPATTLPDQPPPIEPEESVVLFMRDTTGRYYETYGGQTIYLGSKTGRFIWNEGPPRRKNPLGPGASPIVKIYVGEDGKPLEPQPV